MFNIQMDTSTFGQCISQMNVQNSKSPKETTTEKELMNHLAVMITQNITVYICSSQWIYGFHNLVLTKPS